MSTTAFKRVKVNEALEKYILFSFTPEKKLMSIVKDLKDVFPKSKKWKDINESGVKDELLDKFRKRGKFYRDVCQNWLSAKKDLCLLFDEFVKKYDREISASDVIAFTEELKNEHKYDVFDIVLLVHIYVEQIMGMQLFEESASKIDSDLDKRAMA